MSHIVVSLTVKLTVLSRTRVLSGNEEVVYGKPVPHI